jgi:DNA-directed RNA polymerase subunit RPC12/RpoP
MAEVNLNDICKREEFLEEEIRRLRGLVKDLQSGMYINCVYCGHRYGPQDEVQVSMAEALKRHVEQCPAHPMSKLKRENELLRNAISAIPEGDIILRLILEAENKTVPPKPVPPESKVYQEGKEE